MPRAVAVIALVLFAALRVHGGGPAFVAGSGYNAGVMGQPLVWANAHVVYYTDLGALSPILDNSQADAMVATAFISWTSVWGTSLTASQGGHLAEDVSGTNVTVNPDGSISMPADIQPSATTTPVGIVYDADGTVTDALLGSGAGAPDSCLTNAVYGGPDNFNAAGNIVHALVVINGVCAVTNSQLPDVQYRLMRTLGRVIGLGWSQANLNAITASPPPTSDDKEGFPLMHAIDPPSCIPISACYLGPALPKLDDTASLARLYPATSQPPTPIAGIHGTVYFTDASGNAGQPMQGVNVVARLLVNGMPSRRYVVTSVSGFAFRGNAGNMINGFVDDHGSRYDRWGSDDPSLEGYFDLNGLIVPQGQTIALYQLSVEPLDPIWSEGVLPYALSQVAPSGQFTPVTVTVAPGTSVERDIFMLGSAATQAEPGMGSTYSSPAALPPGGVWAGWLSGYGDTDWFEFSAQSNRTASVTVVALDESSRPSQDKLLPVIGMWPLEDQSGGPAPAATPYAFNTVISGTSRLDALFSADGAFRLGIADWRGDGRPDYSYVARVLYSDSVNPSRIGLGGGVVTLNGLGFNSSLQIATATGNASLITASANQIQAAVPAGSLDGLTSLMVNDPTTGGSSQMTNVLTYGAAATDLLLLLQAVEPATAVGSQAVNPIRVRVVAADGVTPVNGATVAWSATGGTSLSVCGGASSCSALSDQAGESSTWVTPMAVGPSTITAALAPRSYNPPQTQQATLVGISSSLDLAALVPTRWIAQGATLDLPLTTQVLNAGVPQPNVVVNYTLTSGIATLSAGSATTNTSGYAAITTHVANLSAQVQVSACVAPNNSPCQNFALLVTSPSLWTLELVSGVAQVVPAGQPFQPLVLRVTDGSTAANPVIGVNVIFDTMIVRIPPGSSLQVDGDTVVQRQGTPVILGTSTTANATTQDGLASIVPSPGSIKGPCDLLISVTAGFSTAHFDLQIVSALSDGPAHGVPFLRNVRGGLLAAMAPGSRLVAVPVASLTGLPSDSPPNTDSVSSAENPLAEPAPAELAAASAADCPGDKSGRTNATRAMPRATGKQTQQQPTDAMADDPQGTPAVSTRKSPSSKWLRESERSCPQETSPASP